MVARAARVPIVIHDLTTLEWSWLEVIDDHRDRSSDDGIQRAALERMATEVFLARVGPVCVRDLALCR